MSLALMNRLAIVCLLLFIGLIPIVEAQDIQLNTPLSGELASGENIRLAFIAREGQLLSFLAQANTNLDPVLSIENNNGDTLISNDDYHYPESKDALIEGFYAPYSGSYTLILSAYGSTSGAYELTMFSGYSNLVYQSNFDAGDEWAAVNLPNSEAATFAVVNGTANLNLAAIGQSAVATGFSTSSETYYIDTEIESISGAKGWQVGLVFKFQDASNYYRVLINNNGAWQLARVQDGTANPLRDWNTHPAIRAGASSFVLGVLVNGDGYDVFYDNTYIGSAYDSGLSGGQVGFAIVTANQVGSEVTARYDSTSISSPRMLNDTPIFPEQLVAAGSNGTVRELERRLLIPAGGTMAFTIPESFAQNNAAGVSVFPMGNQASFSHFVLGVTVSWAASGADLNACGIVVHDDGADNYTLAYVDSTGGYGLSERADTAFIQNSYNNRIESQRPPYQLLLVVNGDAIHYFINGEHVASLTSSRSEGRVGEAVVNFEAVSTNCQYNNFWVWSW